MNQEIEQLKKQAAPILKKSGVTHSTIFGSVARGEEGHDSDVDMVIEFDGKKPSSISLGSHKNSRKPRDGKLISSPVAPCIHASKK